MSTADLRHLLHMDDISVAGPFGENKTRRIGSFDGQNYDDDDDDYTSR